MKLMMSDNGTESTNSNVKEFLIKRGILHTTSTVATPQQNGMAERALRAITEGATTIISKAKMDQNLWAEAAMTCIYASNRLQSPRNPNKTRYELYFGRVPDVGNLRKFGQLAVVKVGTNMASMKFAEKEKIARFVGCTDRSNTFRFIYEEEKNIIVSCDVRFLEMNDKMDNYFIHLDDIVLITNEDKDVDLTTLSSDEEEIDVVSCDESPESRYRTLPSTSEAPKKK